MLKQYNIRLPVKDVKAIDGLGGCRSEHIRTAIRSYIQNDMSSNGSDMYTAHLESEISYLRNQVDVLMVAKIPLLSKIKLKLLNSK